MEQDLELQLRDATSLMTFKVFPVARLKKVPYPSDENGVAIPLTVEAWSDYAETRELLRDIHCFCSLRDGVDYSVKICDLFGELCLSCASECCSFFVNLIDVFENSKKPYTAPPLKTYAAKPEGSIQNIEDIPSNVPEAADISNSTTGKAQPAVNKPWLSYICQGYVTDTDRIWAGTGAVDLRQIQHMPVPSLAETRDVFSKLTSEEDPGITFLDLMRMVAACQICDQIVALATFDKHKCVQGMYQCALPRAASLSSSPEAPPLSSTPDPTTPVSLPRVPSLSPSPEAPSSVPSSPNLSSTPAPPTPLKRRASIHDLDREPVKKCARMDHGDSDFDLTDL
ncbi:hypothetical protein BDY19DRAFT_996163 [Irpex rosettiformis]|uniref:Uncharacterized protein n=1 Tax=Irpex rosettiformis TaxID=378272 RepID=A0ACB8TW52_9APHY|nr:hypothetical protein BDY19DRAFT_996163 [Irpex rosettiformis]